MALLLVCFAMLLLPLVYLGLLGAIAYGLYWHGANNLWLIKDARGVRGSFGAALVYVAPLAIGGTLLLFLCKPMLARPDRKAKPRSLTRQGEPLLFAFVDKLCRTVGAPCPARIDVDSQVNAAAGFSRGWLTILGHHMVLVVGLPLVAGLNLRQFAGVLAHEFGHFTQGWGMRLSYIIRSISHWFTRVVYERDEWDALLEDLSRRGDIRIRFLLYATRGCVWLSRRAMWVLMIVGHAVSGVLLRQMEFDADLHEVRLAGSNTFEATCRRLAVLNVATQGAFADLNHWYRDSRLGDSLPPLIVANVEQLPAELLRAIDRQIDESQTGWFDTHPASGTRIAQALASEDNGLFQDERPATALFSNFAALSRTVTFDFYKAMLGPTLKITDLRSTEALLERQQRENAARRAAARYFQGAIYLGRALPFGSAWIEAPANPSAAAAQLRQTRERYLAGTLGYSQALEEYVLVDRKLLECEQAAALLDGDVKLPPKLFTQPFTGFEQVRKVRRANSDRRGQLLAAMDPFDQLAAQRLTIALGLLHVPQVAAKLPNSHTLVERAAKLLTAAAALKSANASVGDLRNAHSCGVLLTQALQSKPDSTSLIQTLTHTMRAMYRATDAIRSALGRVEYPFQHGRGKMSIAAYCTQVTVTESDLGALLQAGSEILDRLPTLNARVISQLALIAELVENAVGLPPLKEPVS